MPFDKEYFKKNYIRLKNTTVQKLLKKFPRVGTSEVFGDWKTQMPVHQGAADHELRIQGRM